ncbi:proteasome component [Schizosaccharomyces japonicus yFS275]|uniref:Proteasome component n=1 Tax=Schizosaccharomyces japonicus (strain yFS275 / FY16936) TaxID=402676 RepID=B6JXI5_SCHJY|nr:proteasome component [Schizosaccharomyces japonicus yFS275]EEB05129.1 proteasome component [Schizosaccharomyces japonicus yFS275]
MAANELRLLDAVELKLALASSASSFQRTIDIYLAPALLKFESPHDAVRKKTMDIAQHVQSRLNSDSSLQVPLLALSKQYVEPHSELLKQVDAQFLLLGTQRLPETPNLEFTEFLMQNLSVDPKLFLPLLLRLLVHTPPQTLSVTPSPDSLQLLAALLAPHSSDSVYAPLRASEHTVEYRVAVLRWFAQNSWPQVYRWLTFTLGTFDKNTEVSRVAGDSLRQLDTQNLEDDALVSLLLSIAQNKYTLPRLGTVVQFSVPFRAKALQLLCRSILAASREDALTCIESIFQSPPPLHSRLIQFAHWIVTMAKPEFLKNHSESLFALLKRALQQPGLADSSLRGFLYTSLGSVLKADRERLANIGNLSFLFDALKNESPDIRVSIDEALSIVLACYRHFHDLDALFTMLQSYVVDENFNASYAALRYILVVFPFHYTPARTLCVLSQDQSRFSHAFVEEAQKGLTLNDWSLYNSIYYENDKLSVTNTFSLLQNCYPTLDEFLSTTIKEQSVEDYFRSVGNDVFSATLSFAKACIVFRLPKALSLMDDFQLSSFDEAFRSDEQLRYSYGDSCVRSDKIKLFILLCFKGACQLLKPAIVAFFQLTAALPGNVMSAVPYEKLQRPIEHCSITSLKIMLARSYGVMASFDLLHKETAKIEEIFNQFSDNANNTLGSVTKRFLMGYVVASLFARRSYNSNMLPIFQKWLLKNFQELRTLINNGVAANRIAALSSIAECLTYAGDFICDSVDNTKLIDEVISLTKNSENSELTASACSVLSRYSLTLSHDKRPKEFETILHAIYLMYHNSSVDMMFLSAESMSVVAGGWNSTTLRAEHSFRDVNAPVTDSPNFVHVLGCVLDEWIKSPKPAVKKYATLWLLYLTRNCSKCAPLHERLQDIYRAFISCLASQDDFLQETAAIGLKATYDLSSKEEKQSFTTKLMQTITADATSLTQKTSFTEETELFKTNQGKVATYKDICSLANESGNPELLYTFLHVANSSAVWSSRKGAALGLESIFKADKASLELLFGDNMRSSALIAKLYRFKHDPTTSVAETMDKIWKLLSPADFKIEHYRDAIIKECLSNMTDRSWRNRESAVNTLTDLLGGVPLTYILNDMEMLLRMAFRAMDDIKESVRISAVPLCKMLVRSLLNSIEETSVNRTDAGIKRGTEILNVALPFFIDQGNNSTAKEVNAFAYDTVTKLVKTKSPSLSPFVPELAEALLGYLTKYESQVASFLDFHTKTYGIEQSQLDAARVSAVRNSSMMDLMGVIIGLATKESMPKFVSVLNNSLTRTVGVPTKIGASQVCVFLVIRRAELVKPYAPKLMLSLKAACFDRNAAVSESYCAAMGYLCRLLSFEQIENICRPIFQRFFDCVESEQTVCSYLVASILRFASDKYHQMGQLFLPFVFVGKNSSFEKVRNMLTSVYNDSASGGSAVNLYYDEIFNYVKESVTSSQYERKLLGALSLREVIQLARLSGKESSIYGLLSDAIRVRTWPGKENVLEALVLFAKAVPEYLADHKNDVLRMLQTEINRRNYSYKIRVYLCIGDFLGAKELADYDLAQVCYDECKSTFGATLDSSFATDNDLSVDDVRTLQCNLVHCIFSAFRKSSDSGFTFHQLIDIFYDATKNDQIHWLVKQTLLEHLSNLSDIESLKDLNDGEHVKHFIAYCRLNNPAEKAQAVHDKLLAKLQ